MQGGRIVGGLIDRSLLPLDVVRYRFQGLLWVSVHVYILVRTMSCQQVHTEAQTLLLSH